MRVARLHFAKPPFYSFVPLKGSIPYAFLHTILNRAWLHFITGAYTKQKSPLDLSRDFKNQLVYITQSIVSLIVCSTINRGNYID